MIKACLFDLDGVVFDTEPLYTIFWRKIGREFRPDIPNFEHIIKGQTLTQIYDRFFCGQENVRQQITLLLNEYEKRMDYEYVTGFETFVENIRREGVKTAVVTSSNRAKMSNVYRQHPEFQGYFDAILTSEDFAESKPSPDCYLKAAARFGVLPTDCMVFEDSFNGLRSGVASGAHVTGLSTTNTASEIQPYCEEVISNYVGFALPSE